MKIEKSPWLPAPFILAIWCSFQSIPSKTVEAFPSKPLNDRSTELTWQAWLLVDQINRDQDSGQLRRRLTPKSVFIAPTFSPETLPPCADGYQSDPMGRCVNIYKIDPDAQFQFIFDNFKIDFEDYDDDDNERATTQGPLQLTIPLVDDTVTIRENDTRTTAQVAIVLTPVSTITSKTTPSSLLEFDVRGTPFAGDKFDRNDVAAILRVKPEDIETTTIHSDTTTLPVVTTEVPTTFNVEDTTTSPEVEVTALPTTTATDFSDLL